MKSYIRKTVMHLHRCQLNSQNIWSGTLSGVNHTRLGCISKYKENIPMAGYLGKCQPFQSSGVGFIRAQMVMEPTLISNFLIRETTIHKQYRQLDTFTGIKNTRVIVVTKTTYINVNKKHRLSSCYKCQPKPQQQKREMSQGHIQNLPQGTTWG